MRKYTVSHEKDNPKIWYAHMVGFNWIPVWGSFGTKRHALQCAADCMCLTYDQYMEWRKKHHEEL